MSEQKPHPALTAAAVLIATLGAILAAVVCSFLVPLRVGTVPVPVCFLLAIAAAITTVRFVHRVTGSMLATAAPTTGWFLTVVVLASRRAEGDLVVPGSLVGLGLLLVGSMAFGVVAVLEMNAGFKRAVQVHRPEAVTPPAEHGTM